MSVSHPDQELNLAHKMGLVPYWIEREKYKWLTKLGSKTRGCPFWIIGVLSLLVTLSSFKRS